MGGGLEQGGVVGVILFVFVASFVTVAFTVVVYNALVVLDLI